MIVSTTAMCHSTRRRLARAPTMAAAGGSTFQVNVLSMVKTAVAAAVIRLASAPAKRSLK